MPNDNMGSEKNITEKTFQEAAQASGTSVGEAKKNVLEQLKKEVDPVRG